MYLRLAIFNTNSFRMTIAQLGGPLMRPALGPVRWLLRRCVPRHARTHTHTQYLSQKKLLTAKTQWPACTGVSICVCVCMSENVYVSVCVFMSVCVCVCVFMSVCVCMSVCAWVCVCSCLCVCMCVCVFMSVCVYVDIHLSFQMSWWKRICSHLLHRLWLCLNTHAHARTHAHAHTHTRKHAHTHTHTHTHTHSQTHTVSHCWNTDFVLLLNRNMAVQG